MSAGMLLCNLFNQELQGSGPMVRSTAQPFDLERELAHAVASGDPAALLDQAVLLTRKARKKSTLPRAAAALRMQLISHLRHDFEVPSRDLARTLRVTQTRILTMLRKHRERMAAQ